MIRVYLAGPDVFLSNAVERGEYLKARCADQGLIGLFPLDNTVPDGLNSSVAAKWICKQNMQMLSSADVVVANLESFRGHEPDSGTVFEVGAAIALGIPVWAYFTNHAAMIEQIRVDSDGCCDDGFAVENFDLPRNLMLACQWAGASPSFEHAIEQVAMNLSCSSFVANPSGRRSGARPR